MQIDSQGYMVNPDFSQYYNHYHCATVPIYSSLNNEMHTLFFGGIAQYYDSLGILVQDNNVPFVKTIARVTRDYKGQLAEYKLPVEMPALLGAGSEFIPNENLTSFANGVIKMDEIKNDSSTLGYIYGGINSSAENIFWINEGTESEASSQIFKIKLIKNTPSDVHDLNEQSKGSLKLVVYPNPNEGVFTLQYHLVQSTDVKISIFSMDGKVIIENNFQNMPAGDHSYEKQINGLRNGVRYLLIIETAYERAVQKIIVEL